MKKIISSLIIMLFIQSFPVIFNQNEFSYSKESVYASEVDYPNSVETLASEVDYPK